MPDLQKLDVKSKEEFTAVIRAGVSFIKGDFTLNFRLVESEPPTHAKLVARRSGIWRAIDLDTTIVLLDSVDGFILVQVHAEVERRGQYACVQQTRTHS